MTNTIYLFVTVKVQMKSVMGGDILIAVPITVRSVMICMSPNIIRVIRSRKMGWAEYVACLGEKRNT